MIIIWVVFGLVAGLLAKWLLIPQSPEGTAGTMLLGMAGALIGGVFAQGFGWQQNSNPEDLVLVMFGAMLALVIYWQLVETEDVGIEWVNIIDGHIRAASE